MAKPLTSWLVPSFSQHNLRLVVLGRCLHVSVTKFQDKFASLRQVNSPYSWNKFQICCTDMYLIRFLPNFVVFSCFCEFRGILQIYLNFVALWLRKTSEALLMVEVGQRHHDKCSMPSFLILMLDEIISMTIVIREGFAPRKIESSPFLWTGEIQGARHMICIKNTKIF